MAIFYYANSININTVSHITFSTLLLSDFHSLISFNCFYSTVRHFELKANQSGGGRCPLSCWKVFNMKCQCRECQLS